MNKKMKMNKKMMSVLMFLSVILLGMVIYRMNKCKAEMEEIAKIHYNNIKICKIKCGPDNKTITDRKGNNFECYCQREDRYIKLNINN